MATSVKRLINISGPTSKPLALFPGQVDHKPIAIEMLSTLDHVSVLQNEDMQQRILEAQVRTDRAKLLELVKASGTRNVDYQARVVSLIQIRCPLSVLYERLQIGDLLVKNCQEQSGIQKLASAFAILEKYGRNLLKPVESRPSMWRTVQFANGVFRDRVDCIQGSRAILQQMGYTKLVGSALSFADSAEPKLEGVAFITAEVVLARSELDFYLKGTHPFPWRLEQWLPQSARVHQEGPRPIVSSKSALQMAGIPSVPAAAAAAGRVPLPSAELGPGVQPRPPMGEYRRMLGSTCSPGSPAQGSQQHARTAANYQPGPPMAAWGEKGDEAAPSYCDICGDEAASWGCDICDDKKLCVECDDKWHRHPRRKDHRRQRLAREEMQEVVKICDICGEPSGCFSCPTCDKILCQNCDLVWHRHSQRINHKRVQIPRMPGNVLQEQPREPFVFCPQPVPNVQVPVEMSSSQNAVGVDTTIPIMVDAKSAHRTSDEIKISRVSDERIPRLSIFNEIPSSGGASGDILPAQSGDIPVMCHVGQAGDQIHASATQGTAVGVSQNEKYVPNLIRPKSRVTFDLEDRNSDKSSDLELSVDLSSELIDATAFIEPELQKVPTVADIQGINDLVQKKAAVANALKAVKHNISVIDNNLKKLQTCTTADARQLGQNMSERREYYVQEKEKLENFQDLQRRMEQVPHLRSPDRSPEYRNQIHYPPSTFIPPDMSIISSVSTPRAQRPTVTIPPYYPQSALGYPLAHSPGISFRSPLPNTPFDPSSPYAYSSVPMPPVATPPTPVHKGVCPNCQTITNYHRETCHDCGKKIPDYIKEAITPPHYMPQYVSSSMYGPVFAPPLYSQSAPSQASEPKIPSHVTRTVSSSSTSSSGNKKSVSNFQGHPLAWECEHCTIINDAGTRICSVCDRTSEKPRLIQEELEPENKSGGVHGATSKQEPVTRIEEYLVQEQERAEGIALEKKKAQEEFRWQLQREEAERNQVSPSQAGAQVGVTSVGNKIANIEREEMTRIGSEFPSSGTLGALSLDIGLSTGANISEGVSRSVVEKPEINAPFGPTDVDLPHHNQKANFIRPAGSSDQSSSSGTRPGKKGDPLTRVGSEEAELSGSLSWGSSGSESEERGGRGTHANAQRQMDFLAEKKRQNKMAVEGMQLIRLMRQTEVNGHTMEEMEFALNHCGGADPLTWLSNEWQCLVDQVLSRLAQMRGAQPMGVLERQDICRMLAECSGDVELTAQKCSESNNSKLAELMTLGSFEEAQAITALETSRGDVEAAYQCLVKDALSPFLERMWVEQEEPEEDENSIPPDITLRLSTSFADLRALGVITSDCFEDRVRDKDLDFEARLRLVLVEGRLQSWGRAETVLRIVDMDDLEVELTLGDIIEAVRNCGNILDSLVYLQQECQICFSKFPASKIKIMGLCQCHVCSECMSLYLEIHIREKHLRDMVCPVCSEPDMENMELREAHFSFLALMLQNLLGPDLQELFQKKLCDWALMQDPNFRWCSHCEEGFIFNSVNGQLKMKCLHCNGFTCFNCRKPWEVQHENTTCEQFQEWKEANDPDRQAVGLARHLEENGIDCPGCKFHYVLAKGGCMHFTCMQCRFEFCSGCCNPFKRSNCTVLQSCARAGLHCHHPRNCFFYLRDYGSHQLQQLLQSKNIEYNMAAPAALETCPVMEQKETVDGLKDESCGRAVATNQAGLCEIHYKEYLVGLVNGHKIDPVDIMTIAELENLLRKSEKDIPGRANRQSNQEFKAKLIETIQAELPLPVLGLRIHI